MGDSGASAGTATIDAAIVRRAAEWMARLWSDSAGEADRAACAEWRAAHPDHERAWQRLQAMDGKFAALPGAIAQRALQQPAPGRARRRAMQALVLALGTGGLAYSVRDHHRWPALVADYSTGTGEMRDIVLADGTRIVLGTATSIDVRFDGHERRVLLHAGEIMVTTARDAAPQPRPFRVHGRDATVRALGTRFTVRQDGDTSRVNVFEGAVELRPALSPDDAVRVGTGQSTVYSARRVQRLETVREHAAAWSGGLLVAENMRLADFVAELERYRPGLLRCDPAVADLTVSGVFSLRDTDRALHNLTLALPVSILRRTRYWVTVVP